MEGFKVYKRLGNANARPYEPGEDITGISMDEVDKKNGSPKVGDMIARDPDNHESQWLINATFFKKNFELVTPSE